MIESLAIVVRTREGVDAFTEERGFSAGDGAVALARCSETIAAEHNTTAVSSSGRRTHSHL